MHRTFGRHQETGNHRKKRVVHLFFRAHSQLLITRSALAASVFSAMFIHSREHSSAGTKYVRNILKLWILSR